MTENNKIRNVAIIAHVDHGKTTLVDAMLKESGLYRENQTVHTRVMDSKDLEKERGITILSKNTSVIYKGIKINIVDTPGHSDFGGEVERILKMVDGVILVVDSHDGPMPQTGFVLRKALELNLYPLVVINKIDRNDARCTEVEDKILDLFIELGADEEQLDFPVVYASAKDGYAACEDISANPPQNGDFSALLDAVIEKMPCPSGDANKPLQLLVSNIESDPYLGRVGVGKIERGKIRRGQQVKLCRFESPDMRDAKVVKLLEYKGLSREEIKMARAGEIICVAGIENINIGDTVCDFEFPEPLNFINIEEPTVSMTFSVNNSPFAGREGKYVTSRHLRDRLYAEMESNVSMRLEETGSPDSFVVKGRGELHLSILIETMRREGYEFQVSKPGVVIKEIDNKKYEPVEKVTVSVPEEYVGTVLDKMGARRAVLVNILPPDKGHTAIEFKIPTRGLIGYRSQFLSDTRGNGIINSVFDGFEPWKGEIENRKNGVLVAWEDGEAVSYGLYNAQERGKLFIEPGTKVYQGMIVGSAPTSEDVLVNVCKKKHVTNIRAAGSDDALKLTTKVSMSLEQCLEFISDDEYVEVTPQNIRLRKRILNNDRRTKQNNLQNRRIT